MLELAKLNETENKPKNVEEAIRTGWKTAEEMYECAGVCRDTFNEFLSAVRNATLEKSNYGCRIDPTANLVVKLGSAQLELLSFSLRNRFRSEILFLLVPITKDYMLSQFYNNSSYG